MLAVFPRNEVSETEIKKLLGLALEIGVKSSFNLHCYEFGGKLFTRSLVSLLALD